MADRTQPPPNLATAYTVYLSGEIDIAREFDLNDILETYRDSASAHVVVDVGEVTFMDSTGLGFLATLSREAKGRGASVTVARAPHTVVRVIRMTGLDHVLEVEAE